ncbi:putative immunity protein [Pseudonocardia sp. NPDC049635]|uniref:putative immunity protein n=1 Tax=Pseudonocardia sp. NPDC049635 TaxID=3155506 RepID=UPI0033E58A32
MAHDDDAPGVTTDELRAVTRFVLHSADELLGVFEAAHPGDDRPRAAVEAARAFVDGAPRSRRQRVTSLAAHRAGAAAATEPAALAARAAGDAAAAAYLHPPAQVWGWGSEVARTSQVGHVLRAAACAARVAELAAGEDAEVAAGEDAEVAAAHLAESFRRASPQIAGIVRRYPPIGAGRSRVARLTKALDDRCRVGP